MIDDFEIFCLLIMLVAGIYIGIVCIYNRCSVSDREDTFNIFISIVLAASLIVAYHLGGEVGKWLIAMIKYARS